MHVAELGIPERPPVAPRHFERMEDVRQRDLAAVATCRCASPGRHPPAPIALPSLADVGKDHHLREPRLVVRVGDIHLERAEPAAERGELRHPQPLPRKAEHAVGAERPQQRAEIRLRKRCGEIESLDPRPQRARARNDLHCLLPPSLGSPAAAARRCCDAERLQNGPTQRISSRENRVRPSEAGSTRARGRGAWPRPLWFARHDGGSPCPARRSRRFATSGSPRISTRARRRRPSASFITRVCRTSSARSMTAPPRPTTWSRSASAGSPSPPPPSPASGKATASTSSTRPAISTSTSR